MPDQLGADDMPQPTSSLSEFYKAIDGLSRGRKREYFSLDEIPDVEPTTRERLDSALAATAQLDDVAESAVRWLTDDTADVDDAAEVHQDEDGDADGAAL